MSTSPSPLPMDVFILLVAAVPAHAESAMLARASTDIKINHLDFIFSLLGKLLVENNQLSGDLGICFEENHLLRIVNNTPINPLRQRLPCPLYEIREWIAIQIFR